MKKDKQDWLELGREVIQVELDGLAGVKNALNDQFVRAVRLLGDCRGRIVVTGIGKSGLVGRKIAATLSSTGAPSFFLHPVEGAHGDLGMVRPEDVILAISNSGETSELSALLPSLRQLGASLVALTARPDSTLGRLADCVVTVAVEREACPMNLAPTASTTAVLAVGDALAVCLIHYHSFEEKDFLRYHPGGSLGERLKSSVDQLMRSKSLPTVNLRASLSQAIMVMQNGAMGAVCVVDEDSRLKGIFTDGDLRRLIFKEPSPDLGAAVAEHMTANPGVARPGQSVAGLLDQMEGKAITVLPVVDDQGRLVGMIHLHDLLGRGHIKFS